MKRTYIFTGPTALYKKGYIDFNPSKLFVSIERGVKLEEVIKEFNVSEVNLDSETLISFGKEKEKFEGHYIYSNARLLLELNKWDLSSEQREKAKNVLVEKVKANQLVTINHKLRKRRGLNILPEVKRLIDNYESPIKKIQKSPDVKEALKGFLLKVLGESKNTLILKGGTTIQMYWGSNKRERIDIDVHFLKKHLEDLKRYVEDSTNEIRFKIYKMKKNKEELGEEFKTSDLKERRIFKLAFVPITYGNKEQFKDKTILKYHLIQQLLILMKW